MNVESPHSESPFSPSPFAPEGKSGGPDNSLSGLPKATGSGGLYLSADVCRKDRVPRWKTYALGLAAGILSGTFAQATAVLPPNVTSPPWPPEKLVNHNLGLEPDVKLTPLEQTIDKEWKKLHDNYGVIPFLAYWGDFLGNPSGGKGQAFTGFQLLQFGAEVKMERYGWEGGSLFVSGAQANGHNLSTKIGNAFYVAQSVVGMNTIALDNLYLKQVWGKDDLLEFRIGRMAAGSAFANLPIQGLAVSGATNGNPTSLGDNAPFHSSAGTSWAALTKVRPSKDTYSQVGLYQANATAGKTAYHGLNFSVHSTDGLLAIAQTGWTPFFGRTKGATGEGNPGLPGHYQLGTYYSRYTFDSFIAGSQKNAYGFYGQGQQMVWRDHAIPDLNLTLWGGLTVSPQPDISLMPIMAYGGIDLHGPIPGRRDDSLYMNVYRGQFSSAFSSSSLSAGTGAVSQETDLEWGYVIHVTRNLSVQPDLQYLIRPGGTGTIPNAVVAGFQIAAVF